MSRSHRSVARLLAVLLLPALVVLLLPGGGCRHQPPAGWQYLWQEQWQQVNQGERWERGLPADGLGFSAQAGQLLRATLLRTGAQQAEVVLTGPARQWRWQLGDEALAIELPIDRSGPYRFAAPPGVMLCCPRLGRPEQHARLVVLVLVDALRNDHVNEQLLPATLHAFPDWRRWSDMSTQAPWTLPSLTSLFTARPVLEVTTPAGDVIGVPEGFDTWAQVLHDAGYCGAAVVGNYTIHTLNGFGRGFDTYLVADRSRKPPDVHLLVDQARQWLAEHQGEPCFLFLHLMDPHGPYRDHTGQGKPDLLPLAYWDEMTDELATELRSRYAGEVRHLDEPLAGWLRSLPPQAVVALTADHGESLGENGCWAHASCLYQEQMAVPLLLRGPGVPPGTVETPGQLLDLTPTLLELAGVAPAATMSGRSLLQGGSPQPIVAVTYTVGPMRWAWRSGSHKVLLHMASQPGLGETARTRMFDRDRQPAGALVFDLAADPGEQHALPLDGALLRQAGQAFADTAGRTVPGLQLLAWGLRGRQELRLGLLSPLAVVQAWASAPVELHQGDGQLRLVCQEAFPVCAVAGELPATTRVELQGGGQPWRSEQRAGPASSFRSPAEPFAWLEESGAGAALWWNDSRDLVTEGYDQTMERLRALGYLK